MERLILVIIAPILIFSIEWINVCIWDELIKKENEKENEKEKENENEKKKGG